MLNSEFTLAESVALWDEIETRVKSCNSLQLAAQDCVNTLYTHFSHSMALIRAFVTVRFKDLPPNDQEQAVRFAKSNGVAPLLVDDSFVLSLLGTRGIETQWSDRDRSEEHLAIPLVSSDFVNSIPMISELMKEMNIGLDWIDTKDPELIIINRGRSAGMFYVEDSRKGTDNIGRKVIPNQEFVNTYGIKTAFGVGGGYPNGTFISIIFFAKQKLLKSEVKRFLPLIHAFKAGTMAKVMAKSFF